MTTHLFRGSLARFLAGLALLSSSCAGGGAGTPATTVQFDSALTTIDEGGAAADVRVVLLTSETALEQEVRVTVVDLGTGSAVSALDFAAFADQVLTFPVGAHNGDSLGVALVALDDERAEGEAETVRLGLREPTGAQLGARKTHTLNIEDADVATIGFQSTASATPDEQAQGFPVALVVSLPAGVSLDAPVSARVYDARTGTATRNVDYQAFAARSVTVPVGSLAGTIFPIMVDVRADTSVEGAETVVLALDQPSAGSVIGQMATHTLTITDDDIGPGAELAVTRAPTTTPVALSSGAQIDLGSQVNTGGPTGGIVVRLASAGVSALALELPVVSGANERDFDLEFVPAAAVSAARARAGLVLPSPLVAARNESGPGMALEIDAELLAELGHQDTATLVGFAARGEHLQLELTRRPLPWSADALLAIDGVPLAGGPRALLGELQLWSGRVAGEPDSQVFLALSGAGASGWIRRAVASERMLHVLTGGGVIRALTDSELAALGAREPLAFCVDAAPAPGTTAPQGASVGSEQRAAGPWPTCRMALETDFQLCSRLGGSGELVQYVTELVAAASQRYETDIGTALEIAYLGVHTTSNDGWNTPDLQGTTSQMLDEFQHAWGAAWGGSWPAPANLAHFLSGANLGGGIAYLGVLCDQNWGFAVSGNVNGALDWSTWQGAAGPLNWDFIVFTHETGHNFGAQHTHAYCPPLDRCYTSCIPGTQCQRGTLMGYCHLCGGMANVDLRFHPFVANQMRAEVTTSCLGEILLQPGEALDCLLRFDPWTGVGTRHASASFAHSAGNAPSPFVIALVGAATP